MKEVLLSKPFVSEEEYFLFEEKSEVRHEYINSTLFEVPGVSKYHNALVINLVILHKPLLSNTARELFVDGYKVRTPDGNFFYPDLILSEPGAKRYYTENPLMIAEVMADSTRTFDLIDKFIRYRKFESLQYYMCIEPEQARVQLYHRTEAGSVEDAEEFAEWQTAVYTVITDTISMPKLGIAICLQDIYQA